MPHSRCLLLTLGPVLQHGLLHVHYGQDIIDLLITDYNGQTHILHSLLALV